MTSTRERAEKLSIHNVTNLLTAYRGAHWDQPMPVGLVYTPGTNVFSARWSLIRPGYRTDPDNIHHGGRKQWVGVGRENRTAVRDEAIAWCNQRYDYGDAKWVTSGLGDGSYVPEFVAQWLKRRLTQAGV